MLEKEDIKKFQELHKKRFGEEISYSQAKEDGERLVSLIRLVYKPVKKSNYKKLQRKLKDYEQKRRQKM
jgi:hypothetical protein